MTLALPVEVVIDPSLCSPERLADLMEKIQDYGPVLQSVGGVLEEGLLEWFTSRGEGTWALLSVTTIRDKIQRGFGDMPDLVRTGELRAGLTERDAPGHKFLVSASAVMVGVFGDVIPRANWLATGRANMPARVLVNISAGTQERILDLIREWLGGADGVMVYADGVLGNE